MKIYNRADNAVSIAFWLYRNFVSLLCLIFICQPVYSNELHLILNGKSIHTSQPQGINYNERNLGVGLQYDLDEIDKNLYPYFYAGGFSDSYHQPSYYFGTGISYRARIVIGNTPLRVDSGVTMVMMSRDLISSQATNETIFLSGVLPVLSIGNSNVALNMTYIPAVGPIDDELWFFQLKIRLNKT